jgi:hypothetical protein
VAKQSTGAEAKNMKKIVNRKCYDTEKAEEIASYGNNFGGGDFRDMDEALYRTKKGSWFLAGEGGPMTKYSKPCGNMTQGGKDIFVLTNEEAREWLEEHGETEALEEHFAIEEA